MDAELVNSFGMIGVAAAITLSAVGSALGTGIAGMAAIGAWKKCYAQGKAATFLLLAFVGAPLSQTIYGMILMFVMKGRGSGVLSCSARRGHFRRACNRNVGVVPGKVSAAAHAPAETDQGLQLPGRAWNRGNCRDFVIIFFFGCP